MADAAAQKRESRRRRILENSENRLKRITGLYGNGNDTELNLDVVGGSELSGESPPTTSIATSVDKLSVKEPAVKYDEPLIESTPTPELSVTEKDASQLTSNDIKSPSIEPSYSQSSQTSVVLALLLRVRLHIISLAVIVRVFFVLNLGVLFGESALVPLCSVELAEWLILKLRTTEDQVAPSGLLGMALMLSGIAPHKVSHLLRTLHLVNQVSLDFCIYFFAFSLTHIFL